MQTGSERPGTGERLLLLADAFLYAAALDIVLSGIFVTVAFATGFADQDVSPDSLFAVAMQGGFTLTTLVVVGGGALLAWKMHGRAFEPMVGVFMVVGVVLGMPIAVAVLGVAGYLISRIPIGFGGPDDPPWLAIGLLAAMVLALAAVPVVTALRDLFGAKADVKADWLRLGSLVVVIGIAGVALPFIGSLADGEAAEAGIFMVPFAAAAMLAVFGADLYCSHRDKKVATEPLVPT